MEEDKNLGEERNEEQTKVKSESLGKEEIKRIPTTVWNYIFSIFSFKQDKEVNALEVIENIKKEIGNDDKRRNRKKASLVVNREEYP